MALLYYTHNRKPREFMRRVYYRHRDMAATLSQQWVAVCHEPFERTDIALAFDPVPTYADIYRRILAGLDVVDGGDETPVFLVEDDCLYSPEHFALPCRGPREAVYNLNLAYMDRRGFYWHNRGAIALSQLHGTRAAMRHNCEAKLRECLERRLACVEPAQRGGTPYCTGTTRTQVPNLDIRSGYNATWATPDDADFLDYLPGWLGHQELWQRYCGGL